jgi:predicted solute-binding protein
MQDESQTERTKAQDFDILRLGYHDHANLLPLLYPLDAGWTAPPSPWRLELTKATTEDLQAAIERGELDAAFLPTAFVASHASTLAPLGGWALSIEGRTETAVLLAPQRLDLMDGAAAAITSEAAGSSAEHLLRILLKPYYDITLELKRPGDEGYDPKGTRLLYGDAAAQENMKKPKSWAADDLGIAWYVLSGLPMVWLMLAARRDLERVKPGAGEKIQALLKASQRTAQEQKATVLSIATERLGIPSEAVKELFARQRFTLNDNDKKGLARFLDYASRAGLVPG